jgi:hypothetical protein
MGIVVKAIATDAMISARLMQNMIRWYTEDNPTLDRKMTAIKRAEDTTDIVPEVRAMSDPSCLV